jgi:hypothetical protein
LSFYETVILYGLTAAGKRITEKARHALPFTPGFLKMAAELANDQTCNIFSMNSVD